jgi:hypothetical protein
MKTCSGSKSYRHMSGISNTSPILQPNAHDVLSPYFIKSLLHVLMCYTRTPSSRRTSYYLLKTIYFLQCCVYYVFYRSSSLCNIDYVIEHKIHNIFRDLKLFLQRIRQHFVLVILYVKNFKNLWLKSCIYITWCMSALRGCCYSILCGIVTIYVHCISNYA